MNKPLLKIKPGVIYCQCGLYFRMYDHLEVTWQTVIQNVDRGRNTHKSVTKKNLVDVVDVKTSDKTTKSQL